MTATEPLVYTEERTAENIARAVEVRAAVAVIVERERSKAALFLDAFAASVKAADEGKERLQALDAWLGES